MSNIRDIAKLAQVSVATVSRVLNNHPYVKDEKRRAVWQAVQELDYQQNINAVHLSKGKTFVIGVVLPYINHPYFSRLLEGIADGAEANGYKLMVIQTNYQVDKEVEALDMLRLKQVDGVIFTSRNSPWHILKEYRAYGPVVVCENKMDNQISTIYIDHYQAFQRGMELLIQKGHRKIGYCIGRRKGSNSQKRHEAYRDQLGKIGEAVTEKWIFERCLHMEDGARVLREWRDMKEAPTALVVTNDLVAAGIILEAEKLGVSIPDNLAVIGFDDQPLAEALQITTIQLPLPTIGKEAFQQATQDVKVIHKSLPFELVERKTV
ncbi:LacI family DNA-binding transcriptional regulator [Thalassobacillus devorans]|uniref:LacI family DNA-binding transcriptional regulator n=1 Tax=Thalassobacillus devorans TaxID=279813 RepID=UPI0004912946|nr:LacI family DNA-binding transcriptional regulator [Thalassobacillus devorans]